MISKGRESEEYIDISHLREADIAVYYLGVKSIPCLIKSPLREDKKPSFSLFSNNGEEIGFYDYSTREHGSIYDLLMRMWNCSFVEMKRRIRNDLGEFKSNILIGKGCYAQSIPIRTSSEIDIQCKVREWRDYDLKYWNSYGISLEWLKYADVYPISHKIIIKNNKSYVFLADKYAYAYAEFKEGKTTLKIYQPYNKKGFKWANRHDRSVISLWTKVPETGDKICICSSLKDALCLWANIGIPSLALQGEGYKISDTAISELKRRYRQIYILLDNDDAGLQDAIKLAESTGFTNIVLPKEYGVKDISDLFLKLQDKLCFKNIITGLFYNN